LHRGRVCYGKRRTISNKGQIESRSLYRNGEEGTDWKLSESGAGEQFAWSTKIRRKGKNRRSERKGTVKPRTTQTRTLEKGV